MHYYYRHFTRRPRYLLLLLLDRLSSRRVCCNHLRRTSLRLDRQNRVQRSEKLSIFFLYAATKSKSPFITVYFEILSKTFVGSQLPFPEELDYDSHRLNIIIIIKIYGNFSRLLADHRDKSIANGTPNLNHSRARSNQGIQPDN